MVVSPTGTSEEPKRNKRMSKNKTSKRITRTIFFFIDLDCAVPRDHRYGSFNYNPKVVDNRPPLDINGIHFNTPVEINK